MTLNVTYEMTIFGLGRETIKNNGDSFFFVYCGE